jgi:hypothetical protein
MIAPERIWAWYFMPEKRDDVIQGGWTDQPDKRETQYIRDDLHDATKAQLAAAVEALRTTTQILTQCLFETILVKGQYLDRKEVVTSARAVLAEIEKGGQK